MTSLERSLRKDLEKTVKQARRVAEAGAAKAVAQLGVGDAEAPKHLAAEQRALRNRLRAHGRQLGDRRDTKTGVQVTYRLVQECAYEHWHRMLFARFLAETDLLIEPESGVAITLDEVQELAREKSADWLPLASDYAERMLPQIFRRDDPVLDIALPPETRSQMEDLLKGLTQSVFEADDSLGWVYQFWQADKKEEVNKSEVKIGADELPAVTQLFTEDYMVLFLLHNSLGAWWAGKVLSAKPALATTATSEDELHTACKVGDIDWTYLRFVRDKGADGSEGSWRPAAGVFEGWPKAAKDITVLDPCMGSGHFLVFALPILVAIRMAEEGASRSDAIDAVLRDNLFGLEIDPRCTQIAAFNLAFAAWRKVGYRPLPQLNLACSGLAIGVTKAEWLKLAEKAVTAADPAAKRDLLGTEENLLTTGLEERVKNGLEALYDLFAKAPWLGSLIDPRRAGADIFREGFDKLEPLLASILAAADTDDAREMAVAAQGMAKAAELLGKKFTLVATNAPYLGRGKQDEVIQSYCSAHFPAAKTELATCILQKAFENSKAGGAVAIVVPQSWWFLARYKSFRKYFLSKNCISLAATLGEEAWQAFGDRGPLTACLVGSKDSPMPEHVFSGINALPRPDIAQKIVELTEGHIFIITQVSQLQNPESRIIVGEPNTGLTLRRYASCFNGIVTGDYPRFSRKFWEVNLQNPNWHFVQTAISSTAAYGGRSDMLLWDGPNGEFLGYIRERLGGNEGAWIRGKEAWEKKGLLVGGMRDLPMTLYGGHFFNNTATAVIPSDEADLPALWCFAESGKYFDEIRTLNKKVSVTDDSFVQVPIDIEYWRNVAGLKYPNGLPPPNSDDPTQWIFHGRPCGSKEHLQTAVVRLLGYSWPRQTAVEFLDCSPLGPDGLDLHSDIDGIVCLTALKGEPPAEQRLNALLADAFGSAWSAAKLAGLLADAGFVGKSFDDWLRDGFFAQHCELFHQRPFVWQIWDGRRDGFHALVNYHRLAAPNGEGRRTLEKLIYSYLGDWIDRQRADQKAEVESADARLAHAEHLKAELIKILEGEPPHDIFVRWKPLHEQPLGWDPDINDGVRMNIRPFITARPLGARGANACILRTTPKIKWDKDRGKEPVRDMADYPWFWGWDETTRDFAGGAAFDGNRWNDLHYSREAKQAARDRHRTHMSAKLSGAKP
ncbi:MAG TPA: hypothetical protein VG889_00890 [Rhizomicrobium sp.]|nr:hypothetical protein [Rhizomicrobium sp.]